MTQARIAELFAGGWEIVDVQPACFELLVKEGFDGQAWMAHIGRR